MKKFNYVLIEITAKSHAADACFILKLYKHKGNFYYKTYYSRSRTDTTWVRFDAMSSMKFQPLRLQGWTVTWNPPEIFSELL